MALRPAWATELKEEWIETSPSPPHQAAALLTRENLHSTAVDSLRVKRGSLRALGHAAPRGLPTSRANSAKIISGHGEGRVLSERSSNITTEDVLSPPSSRSSSGAVGEVAGTFLVKEGVEDDRGKALAKKGRDMFGPTALEKMFQPPSPPDPPERPKASSNFPENTRRASNPYAPANPSRLSKSMTPSTASSITMSELPTKLDISLAREDAVIQSRTSSLPQQDFSFIYPAPEAQSSTATAYEAPLGTAPYPSDDQPVTINNISHSTLREQPGHARNRKSSSKAGSTNPGLRLFRSTYDTYTREHLSALVDSIAIEPSPSPTSIPNTRDLREWSPSASISGSGESESSDMRSSKRMRMSPSSPEQEDRGVRDWGAQGRAILERIRARKVESATSASVSRSDELEEGKSPVLLHMRLSTIEDGPTIEYPAPLPPPPLQGEKFSYSPSLDLLARRTHHSNPSTTSSGYLRAAADLMARIKARPASESASSVEHSSVRSGRKISPSAEVESDQESKGRSKNKVEPSPRRMLRRLSTSEEVKRVTEQDSGDDQPTIQDETTSQRRSELPAPKQLHVVAESQARFPTSTTVAISTSISTSVTKHAGSHVASRDGMRIIRPDEIRDIVPEKVGKMRYDQAGMRWVKDGLGSLDQAGESRAGASEESEDVFAGFESWREEIVPQHKPDESLLVDEMRQNDTSCFVFNKLIPESPPPPPRPIPIHAASAPAILTPVAGASGSLRPIRSALRNANTATPAGALKKRTGWHVSVTPASGSGSKRSVSFSDGKKSGKMSGVFTGEIGERSWMQSVRTKRIEGMLENMEELSQSFLCFLDSL